ncbi:MAG: CYTH domain-containing protein [Proteiniphilum sp.]|jgi:CYTH domain-containing protein|nr:CYTH domain-containing protein [Proteiniphilum sp.]
MGYEIERKFLVKGDYKPHTFKSLTIRQGYLSRSGACTVRIRTGGGKAFITVKSALTEGESKIKRHEWEYGIPAEDATEMLLLCEGAVVEKTRHLVRYGGHLFEVDEFSGDNEGLVIAEIELEDEDEPFDRPEWLGDEVTGMARYYNSYLSGHPYKEWSNQ